MKKFLLLSLELIELILAIFLALNMAFFGFDDYYGVISFNDKFYIAYIEYFSLIVLAGIEIIIRKKVYSRFLFIIIGLFPFFSEKDNLNRATVLSIYSILVIIFLLLTITFDSSKKSDELSVNNLPAGIVRTKDNLILSLAIYICIFACICAFFAFENKIIAFSLIGINCVCFFIFIIMFSYNDPIKKINKEFLDSANYLEYLKKFETFEKEKLHRDTIIYLKLLKLSGLYFYNEKKYFELCRQIEEPKFYTYKEFYKIQMANYYINMKDRENSSRYIKSIKDKNAKKELNNMFELAFGISKECPNLPIEGVNTFPRLANLEAYLTYYINKNDYDNAKKYAQMILDMNLVFPSINEKCKNILSSNNDIF